MDSRLWSESLPEPQASGKFVLSARKHFGCLKTQLAMLLEHEFSFVKLAIAVPLREKHPKTPFVVRPQTFRVQS